MAKDFTFYNAVYLDTQPGRVEAVRINAKIFLNPEDGEWEYILDEIRRYHILNGDFDKIESEDVDDREDEFNDMCYDTLNSCNSYVIEASKMDILTMINCFNLIILWSKKLSAYVLFVPGVFDWKDVKHYAISNDYPTFLNDKFNISLKEPTEKQLKELSGPLKYEEIPEF